MANTRALNSSARALTATLGVRRDWTTQKSRVFVTARGFLTCPRIGLAGFWQSERTKGVLDVHCLDSWVLPQNCGVSSPLPVKNTLGLHKMLRYICLRKNVVHS